MTGTDMERIHQMAQSIHGWTTRECGEWLMEKFRPYESICEIGVWHGRTACYLAHAGEGTYLGIDHLKGSPEHQPLGRNEMLTAWVNGAAKWLPTATREVRLEHRPLRYNSMPRSGAVLVDADHSYEGITEAIETAFGIFDPDREYNGGRMVIVDDYGHADWPGVRRAVDDFVAAWWPCTTETFGPYIAIKIGGGT